MKQKINKSFLIYILCISVVFLFASIVLGSVLKMFLTIPYYDKCLHFLSAALITSVIGFWLAGKANLKPLYAMLFAFCFAVMVGAMFEIVEFALDSIFTANNQHWIGTEADRFGFLSVTMQGSGLVDTMGDIIVNTLGGAVTSVIGFFWLRRK